MTENVNGDGSVAFAVVELAPGAQELFNVTVRPKLFGIYESTRAKIKYNSGLPSEDGEEDVRSGLSTSLGRIRIISTAEHLRSTSYYIREWVTFSLGFSLAIIVPFINWWALRSAHSSKKYKKT